MYEAWNVVRRNARGERVVVWTVEYYSGEGPYPWDPQVRATLPSLAAAPVISRSALDRRLRQLKGAPSRRRVARQPRSRPWNGYLPMTDWQAVLAERVA